MFYTQRVAVQRLKSKPKDTYLSLPTFLSNNHMVVQLETLKKVPLEYNSRQNELPPISHTVKCSVSKGLFLKPPSVISQ